MSDDIYDKLKKRGKGLVVRASDLVAPERIPTGSLGLDIALDGGWPLARVVTIWGVPGSTKSTLCLWTVANAQKQGKNCLWIDAEKSFTKEWGTQHGVDVENLYVTQTRSLEEIEKIAMGDDDVQLDVIVVDSVSAVNAAKYFVDHDHSIGLQAKVTKRLIAELQYHCPQALIMLISQATTVFKGTYVNIAPTGGWALEHESSIMCKLHVTGGSILLEEEASGDKSVGEFVGADVTWELTKNKVTLPWQKGVYRFKAELGHPDARKEVADLALQHGIIRTAAAWIYFGDEKWNGKEKFIEALEDADIYGRIKNEILEKTGG